MIPPTHPDQIDVDKLDIEKFKHHAARKGIDPETITRETILESFNPVQTWIEFCNRLATLPLGLATLLLALFSFTAKQNKVWIIGLSWFCLLDVVANAVMGAIVVRSGLQPGVITLHMALAFLLIIVLVTLIWLSRPEKSDANETGNQNLDPALRKKLLIVSLIFFACLFSEGLLGSQLREQTDELTLVADQADIGRDQWMEQLGATLVYKVHRSFSWSLLIASGLLMFWTRPSHTTNSSVRFSEPKLIFAIVFAMMLMGIVMSYIAIFQVVQVLHVGATAVLLAIAWHWIVRLWFSKANLNKAEP